MLVRTTPPPDYDPYDDFGALNADAWRRAAPQPPLGPQPVGYPRDVATDEAHLRAWHACMERARDLRTSPHRPIRWHRERILLTAQGTIHRMLAFAAQSRRAVSANRAYRRGCGNDTGRTTP